MAEDFIQLGDKGLHIQIALGRELIQMWKAGLGISGLCPHIALR